MAFVVFDGIGKKYDDVTAVRDFNLSIEKGQFVAFVGPSGCGKSTVLRMTAGLEAISSGEIRIDGKIINTAEPKDRDIAMVFQNYALYPDKTVNENMGFGLHMRNFDRNEIDKRVRKAADTLGIGQLLERRPAQLSGGQRQRVAVGRVIVRDPKVFLFDEPLSNLDSHLRGRMRKELIKLHKQLHATMIYVTHDQVEAMTMGDIIVVMRDGEIQQHGKPLDVFDRPTNIFVASFIGAPPMNLLSGIIREDGNQFVFQAGKSEISLPNEFSKVVSEFQNKPIIFGVRPHTLRIGKQNSEIEKLGGRIALVEQLGTETLVEVELEDAFLQMCLPPTFEISESDVLELDIDFSTVHFFDAETEAAICHGVDIM
jgi:multiple sugar transport system ATP-binding protein